MIKKIKKVLVPIFLSVVCGSIFGRLVYSVYDSELENVINGKKVYLIQSGAYSSYDTMVSNTSLGNYVYYEDDGLFKSIIGITGNFDNIEKIKNTYEGEVIVSEYYSMDLELLKKIEGYDKKIDASNNLDNTKKIVVEMLSLYKNKDTTLKKIVS